MWIAAIFLFCDSLALTFAPAVRLHAWTPLNLYHWAGFIAWFCGFFLLHREMERSRPEADPYLLPVAALLVGWGMLTIWRLDATVGARQTIWFVLAIFIVRAGLRKPGFLDWLRNYKYVWLTLGLLITTATFFLGTYPGGAGPRLWLGCCGVYLQPSEPLKLLLIIYLAAYLADRMPSSIALYGLLAPTVVLFGVAMGLLLAQRDMGTALLFIFIYTLTLYLASGRKRMLLLSLTALVSAAYIGYRLIAVVRARIDSWINPWVDSSGHSYQIIQALIAFAAGGIFGRGPGLGSPGLVPVAHSDFIFAAIGEETGMLGVFAMIVLYVLIISRGLKIAVSAPVRFQRYLAAGISTYLAVQTILIMGGSLRLLPLTGVTLPFVSYGGSSLLTTMAALLILISCSPEVEDEPAPLLRPAPYLVASGLFIAGFFMIGTLAAFWSFIEQDQLLSRNDNPRMSISDRYVPRGAMLDRDNHPIVVTSGAPGNLVRTYLYPSLSHITGYNDPLYGLAGLEESLGPYLRGIKGNPSSLVWWHSLIYSQPPPGLDVRLSIALNLQSTADQLLGEHKGAVVLVNARTGEILAMVSHPNYDANLLGQDWTQLTTNQDAPLFNRATQASYLPGPALGPFLMADFTNRSSLPELSASMAFRTPDGNDLDCVTSLGAAPTWGEAVRAGCPAPLLLLSKQYLPSQLDDVFERMGLYHAPSILLPVSPQKDQNQTVNSTYLASIGMDTLTVSPLQMALAASTLSSGGKIPAPTIALAVHIPAEGWVILPGTPPVSVIPTPAAGATAQALAEPGKFYWRSLAVANGPAPITWYIGGTLSQWQGTPLAIAVAIEENNPSAAEAIGKGVMDAALK